MNVSNLVLYYRNTRMMILYNLVLPSQKDSPLLLMSYVMRHNLTGVALQDLFTMFNEHFPGLVPATSYLFQKANGRFGQYVPQF